MAFGYKKSVGSLDLLYVEDLLRAARSLVSIGRPGLCSRQFWLFRNAFLFRTRTAFFVTGEKQV